MVLWFLLILIGISWALDWHTHELFDKAHMLLATGGSLAVAGVAAAKHNDAAMRCIGKRGISQAGRCPSLQFDPTPHPRLGAIVIGTGKDLLFVLVGACMAGLMKLAWNRLSPADDG